MNEGDTNNPWGDQAPPANPWNHPEAPTTEVPPSESRWNTSGGSTPPPVLAPPPPPVSASSAPVSAAPAPPANPHAAVPAPSPVGQPLFAGDFGAPEAPVAPEAPTGPGRAPWILAVIGALTLLVGGGFFAMTALGAQGGAETPEAAVDALIESLNNEDFITLGEMIDPSERRTVVEPVLTDVMPELVRIGVFSDEMDASQVQGLDLELTDVTYRIDSLPGQNDMRLVYFTGGSAASTFTAADFPLGDALREYAADDLQDESETNEIADDEVPMALVERDGRWYLSMWHSVAEGARLSAGAEVPNAALRPTPLGSESPEAAVEAWITEMTELDLEGLIGRLDPDEMDALYRYSPLFLADAQEALDTVKDEAAEANVSWEVTNLELDTNTSGDDGYVEIVAATLLVDSPDVTARVDFSPERIYASIDGQIDGRVFSGSFELTPDRWTVDGQWDGDVVELDVNFNHDAKIVTMSGRGFDEQLEGTIDLSETVCGSYNIIAAGEIESGCLTDEGESVESFITVMEQLEEGFGGIAIKTRKTDGEWFISPIGTSMDRMVAWLQNVDDDGFTQMLDTAELAGSPLGMAGGAAFDLGTPDGGLIDPGFDDFPMEDTFPAVERTEFVVDPPTEPALFVDQLPAGGEHVYSLPMTAGQTIGITVEGADQGIEDPQVGVDGPGGRLMWGDDENGLDVAITFTAPETGQYDIVVSAWDSTRGVYELGLHVVEAGTAPAIGGAELGNSSTPVADGLDLDLDVSTGGVVHDGELGDGATDSFHVQLLAGSEWLITYEADPGTSIDPYLSIFDEELQLLAENDDAAADAAVSSSFDSQLRFTVPETGTYTIQARSFGFSGSGGYMLAVTPVAAG